jgi:methylthioribose-1-phosphate isomerase
VSASSGPIDLAQAPGSGTPAHDPARRAFIRQFGRQAATTVGQVAGMADVMSRTTAGATAGLLGLLGGAEPRPKGAAPAAYRPARSVGVSDASVGPVDDVYRSPFRLHGKTLRILDQRSIPGRLEEVVARRGSDVVHYLRLGVCAGGPLVAQLAAYGQALTAAERASQPPSIRDLELERTMKAFLEVRPGSPLLRWALSRQQAVAAGLAASAESGGTPGLAASEPRVDGAVLATALRSEADAIASELQAGLAAIAEHLTRVLAQGRPSGPLAVLVHGDPGALHGGLIGGGITALRQLRDQGREVRVLVTESRPSEAGLRLASWELRQAGIEHTVVPDTAAAWIIAHEPIDAVIVAAEAVAANGDAIAPLGSHALGRLASAQRASSATDRPALFVTVLTAAIDASAPDGSAIPVEVPLTAGRHDPSALPASEVVAAADISALVTERGPVAPGETGSLATIPPGVAPSASLGDRPPSPIATSAASRARPSATPPPASPGTGTGQR